MRPANSLEDWGVRGLKAVGTKASRIRIPGLSATAGKNLSHHFGATLHFTDEGVED